MLEQEIAKKLFAPKNRDEIPTVLCRRNVPHKLTYALHDYTWEGLKKVTRHGRTDFEIDRNFVLRIETDGSCRIPKTPNNLKRLERITKPSVTKGTRMDFDYVTGEMREREIEIVEPPMYERIEDSLFEQELISRLAEMVKEKSREQEPEYAYAEEQAPAAPVDTYVKPLPEVREVAPIPDNVDAMETGPEVFGEEKVVVSEPVKRGRGRPRKA